MYLILTVKFYYFYFHINICFSLFSEFLFYMNICWCMLLILNFTFAGKNTLINILLSSILLNLKN